MTDKASAIRPDMVRELAWNHHYASTPFGDYYVHTISSDHFMASFNRDVIGRGSDSGSSHYVTIDEAKAAISVDYASRILSALSPAFIERMAALEAENARLRGALTRLSGLTPIRANARSAHDLHLTVKAIADTALDGGDIGPEQPWLSPAPPFKSMPRTARDKETRDE